MNRRNHEPGDVREHPPAAALASNAQKERERLILALEASKAGVWDWDIVTNTGIRDERCCSLYGMHTDDTGGLDAWMSRVHPDDRKRLSARLTRMLETPGDDQWREELRVVLPDGRQRWITEYGQIKRDSSGRAVRASGLSIDITELKQTEEALREANQRLEAHMENAPLAVIEFDREFRIRRWSNEAERMFGWTAAEVVGRVTTEVGWICRDDAEQVGKGLEAILTGDSSRRLSVNRNCRKDGSVIVCEWYNSALYDSGGRLTSIVSHVLDVTERSRAQAELKQSEARYRMLHEGMRDAFVYVAMDGRFLDFNSLYCEMLGYSPEEVRKLTYQEITPERWHAYEDAILRDQILTRGYSEVYEKEYRRKDGSIFPIELRTILERDSAGTPVGMWGVVRDISQRKAAEAALRESEERFRLFMENSPTISWVKDESGRYQYFSPTYGKRSDIRLSEWQGKTDVELFPPEFAAEFRKNDLAVLASGRATQVVEVTEKEDGSRCYWLNTKFPYSDSLGRRFVAGIGLDITEQKKTEKALRESVQRERERASDLAAVLDAAPTPIFIARDADCRHISGNRAADELLRHPHGSETSFSAPDDLRPRHFKPFKNGKELRPEEMPAQRAARGEALKGFEFSLVFDDGEVRQVLGYGTPRLDEQGRSRGSVLVLVDVTDLKETEDRLRESEQGLRMATEVAKIGAFDWDIRSGVNIWTSQLEEMHGLAKGEFGRTQASWEELVHPEDRARALATVEKAFVTGEPVEHDYRIIRPDGSVHWLVGRFQCFKDATGNPVRLTGVNINITERKLAEEALRKMKNDLEATVRERTAELSNANQKLQLQAHQLRQLAGELTTAELRERKRLAKILHDGLQQHLVAARLQVGGLVRPLNCPETNETAKHVEKILEDALTVSRTLAAELSPPILHDSGLFAGLQWLSRWMSERHGLKIEVRMEQTDVPIMADDVKAFIFEAVRELLLNVAKHAQASAAEVHLCIEDGSRLRATVNDNGVGFDAAALLETGKSVGGFGLFSIRERIALIGGGLHCKTAPGKGASLTLTVPIVPPSSPDECPPSPARRSIDSQRAAGPSVGRIRIMLVDDHAVMREGLAKLLAYEPDMEVVGQASDGRDAVEKAASLNPDVVLMDLSMPVMDGVEATKAIFKEHPGIRIIGLSLYSAEERAKEMLDAGASFYLTKTGPPADLKAAIRMCKEGNASGRPGTLPLRRRIIDPRRHCLG